MILPEDRSANWSASESRSRAGSVSSELLTAFSRSLRWKGLSSDPPLLIFAIPPLALFVFKVGKIIFLYRRAVGVNLKDAFCAALAGLALSHTIAKAVLYGFFTTSIPFFRTPKNADNHGFWVAISEAREELFIMLLLWGAALGIYLVNGMPSNDMRFWVVMLLVQSLPYLAALIMAFLSSLPKPAAKAEPAPVV